MTYLAFPDTLKPLTHVPEIADKLTALGTVLIAAAVAAFAAAPFFRLAQRLLEGDLLPPGVASALLARQVRMRDRQSEQELQTYLEMGSLPEEEAVVARISNARDQGLNHKTITNWDAIDQVDRMLMRLRRRRRRGANIGAAMLAKATAALVEALSQNCADVGKLEPPVRRHEAAGAERLDRLRGEFVDRLAPYAIHRAQTADAAGFEQKQRAFSEVELKATRLGNQAAALRAYCQSRYGIDFDYFWPRFLLVLQRDPDLSAAIVGARVPFEFALVAFVLTVASLIGWLGVLTVAEDRLELTVGLLVLGPLLARFWLAALQTAHDAFVETVKGAIDVGRFRLVEALRLPLPTSLTAERTFWDDLSRFGVLGLLDDEALQTAPLKHPAK